MSLETGTTTIAFSEFAVGTYVTNQYRNVGIEFTGDSPFITTDIANSGSQCFPDTQDFKAPSKRTS